MKPEILKEGNLLTTEIQQSQKAADCISHYTLLERENCMTIVLPNRAAQAILSVLQAFIDESQTTLESL